MKNPVLSDLINFRYFMKRITSTLIITLISFVGYAQSLSISETGASAGNRFNQFTVAGHQLNITDGMASYASNGLSFDINAKTALGTSLTAQNVMVYGGAGELLITPSYKLIDNDESARVYSGANGSFIIRENIANFLFYDSNGQVVRSVSNSSQSTEGESVSELSADPMLKTVVLYNPKIVRNGVEGSRAQIIRSSGTTRDIFYSTDRAIRSVEVSNNGQFIAVISYRSGTDDEVSITDRYGNDLSRIDFNQTIEAVQFSDDGEYLTLRSGNRVGVYSLLDGEREGSTSFRSSLHYAKYIPEDDAIIALTGDERNGQLTGVELHAINLAERKIERQEYNTTLGITRLLPLELSRTASNRYKLEGLSRSLEIRVQY